ncbi:MAG: porin [Methylotenera sp.]
MNNTIKLAVAAALLAGASSASAGIMIPAGDWTVDIGGNVNAYYTHTSFSGNQESNTKGAFTNKSANTVQTGLLPSAFGIGAKTRQNDLDVAFQLTYFVGSDSGTGDAFGNNTLNVRQSFLSFGDKSWGTIKAGRDLGIFGSDAILSDMTLLGVGSGAGQGGTTTLGRIGSGYQYADWIGQISYASPNWNGFSFAAGIDEGLNNAVDNTNHNLGYQAKASYDWAGDVAGKVWVGALSNKHEGTATIKSYTTTAWELGGKVDVAGFGLVGYYYDGRGLSGSNTTSTNAPLNGGINFTSTSKTDDKGGYVQGTYTIPGVGTKLGLSWGTSQSEAKNSNLQYENEAWIIGAYHPLTKHLNLVAEYTDNKIKQEVALAPDLKLKAKTVSLGAILFF